MSFLHNKSSLWNLILWIMLRQKGKLQLCARYIYHYRFSFFYWLFLYKCLQSKVDLFAFGAIQLHFSQISHKRYIWQYYTKGVFFNNNLIALSLQKCIYNTWRGNAFKISLNRNSFCASGENCLLFLTLRRTQSNKTKPQSGKDFHDASGEL